MYEMLLFMKACLHDLNTVLSNRNIVLSLCVTKFFLVVPLKSKNKWVKLILTIFFNLIYSK